ncbi:hypothetical protein B0H17DRAFT_471144 [Mycena rosella]|uniref:Uncharacterized protein n=1 Tax=Mycena rosella TaxID=1033263 RepID=A0AAD7DLH5_MYCRO|nr:hypothetical protein B0H17DRAFT_471144 [Mycena rosella]
MDSTTEGGTSACPETFIAGHRAGAACGRARVSSDSERVRRHRCTVRNLPSPQFQYSPSHSRPTPHARSEPSAVQGHCARLACVAPTNRVGSIAGRARALRTSLISLVRLRVHLRDVLRTCNREESVERRDRVRAGAPSTCTSQSTLPCTLYRYDGGLFPAGTMSRASSISLPAVSPRCYHTTKVCSLPSCFPTSSSVKHVHAEQRPPPAPPARVVAAAQRCPGLPHPLSHRARAPARRCHIMTRRCPPIRRCCTARVFSQGVFHCPALTRFNPCQIVCRSRRLAPNSYPCPVSRVREGRNSRSARR